MTIEHEWKDPYKTAVLGTDWSKILPEPRRHTRRKPTYRGCRERSESSRGATWPREAN
jgi:hypothetical protein